jgi:N-acetylglucosamine-6-sulfatase
MAHLKVEDHIRPVFDYWFSFIGQGEYFDPQVNENGKEYKEQGYITNILTEKAIS